MAHHRALTELRACGYLSGHNLLVVNYEEDLATTDRWCYCKHRIGDFLLNGIDPLSTTAAQRWYREVDAVPRSVKQNAGPMEQKILNYRALNLDRWLEDETNYHIDL
jgi:hypothetical protein